MIKMKKWESPEVNVLGINKTNDETSETGILIHMCNYCGKVFLTHNDEKNHEKDCYKNPTHKPVNPLPDGDESDWFVPAS